MSIEVGSNLFPNAPIMNADAMFLILNQIDRNDLLNASLVCKQWYRFISRRIWADFVPGRNSIKHLIKRFKMMRLFRRYSDLYFPLTAIKSLDTSRLSMLMGLIDDRFLERFASFVGKDGTNCIVKIILNNCYSVGNNAVRNLLNQSVMLENLVMINCSIEAEQALCNLDHKFIRSIVVHSLYPPAMNGTSGLGFPNADRFVNLCCSELCKVELVNINFQMTQQLAMLEHLKLSGCNEAQLDFSLVPNLKTLEISNSSIRDDFIYNLITNHCSKVLETLILHKCPLLTKDGLSSLIHLKLRKLIYD